MLAVFIAEGSDVELLRAKVATDGGSAAATLSGLHRYILLHDVEHAAGYSRRGSGIHS